jgi:hypothetical protein
MITSTLMGRKRLIIRRKSVTAGTPVLMVAKSAVAPQSMTFVRALGFNVGADYLVACYRLSSGGQGEGKPAAELD